MSKKDDKMDIDITISVENSIKKSLELSNSGKFREAVEELFIVEKQTRLAQQGENTTKVVVELVNLCGRSKRWKELNETILVISKKRGQIKQAISKMVQEGMKYIVQTPDIETRVSLINCLREVSEGKIYVEVERANLVRMLATIKEKQGDIAAASDLLQEVQIETIGSMGEKEKIEYILESMRLTLLKKDYVRTFIISKKITSRAIGRDGIEKLKIRYNLLMVEYWSTQKNYLEICRCYHNIYHTPNVENPYEVLQFLCLFIILSPYCNEQSDLVNRIFREKRLQESKLGKFKKIVKFFITHELINWNLTFVPLYNNFLKKHPVFQNDQKRFNDLKDRVIEHNIRVVSKYYSKIEMKRFSYLLGTNNDDTEKFVSKLVTDGIIQAKIDRIDGVVFFRIKQNEDVVLNSWNSNVAHVLDLLSKTNHLIDCEVNKNKV